MNTIIRTTNITKKFGSFAAVQSLDLAINKGDIYGFIGLNGAGKTTTIRMLLGMVKPTEGQVDLFGEPISRGSTQVWAKVGHLVETAAAYPELTVWENLECARRLYRLRGTRATGSVMDRLGLSRYRDKKAKHLSLGNYQRLSVARALLHEPELLILDEPTNGLDPAGIVEMRELLKDMAANKGVTVLISSHLLSEVYRFVSRIGIIHEGSLIDEVTIDMLNARMKETLVLDAADRPGLTAALKKLGYAPEHNEAGETTISDEGTIRHPEQLIAQVVGMGVPLTKASVAQEDLERYFLDKVGFQ